jgi:hypothetical protein
VPAELVRRLNERAEAESASSSHQAKPERLDRKNPQPEAS